MARLLLLQLPAAISWRFQKPACTRSRRWCLGLSTLAQALTGDGWKRGWYAPGAAWRWYKRRWGVLGYARNQLGTAAQRLTSAVDGFFELQANDQIHLEAMLASQDTTNLLDLTSGYIGLVKF